MRRLPTLANRFWRVRKISSGDFIIVSDQSTLSAILDCFGCIPNRIIGETEREKKGSGTHRDHIPFVTVFGKVSE